MYNQQLKHQNIENVNFSEQIELHNDMVYLGRNRAKDTTNSPITLNLYTVSVYTLYTLFRTKPKEV